MKEFSLLYVDDEEINLRIFKDTFRRKFNVYTALSASEGMKILDNNKIDLVLSDQRMPEITGVEFLRYSLEKYPEPNRILITGYSDIDAIENAINYAHIFQYIQKPWDEKELLKVIENALRLYDLEQENRKQKEELIKAKEKAEESDRLKTEFINNMSHEIRTPMNGILGFTEFLYDPDLAYEQRKSYVDIIQTCGSQLVGIIDDILEVSHLGTKIVKVDVEAVCINHLLDQLASIYSHKSEEKQLPIKINKTVSDEESTMLTDKMKLNKILTKLLENAFKFTHSGYIEIGYRMKKEEPSSLMEIFVLDTGIGIKKEDQDEMFKRFTQGYNDIKLREGLGLGLAIAKENALLIGGSLSVKSEKNEGSEFIITIPYKPAKLEFDPNDIKKDEESLSCSILIAEDEEYNYMYLEELLKQRIKMNCNIIHARNGEEAIDIYKKNKGIKVVLMDIKMPIMDGYEATKSIKKMHPESLIIAQTAYSTSEDKEKAMAAGCDDFISKPIDAKNLMKMMDKYLSV